jgi:hypothetical protein
MRIQALSPKLVLLLFALCTIAAIAVGSALATHIGQVHPLADFTVAYAQNNSNGGYPWRGCPTKGPYC